MTDYILLKLTEAAINAFSPHKSMWKFTVILKDYKNGYYHYTLDYIPAVRKDGSILVKANSNILFDHIYTDVSPPYATIVSHTEIISYKYH